MRRLKYLTIMLCCFSVGILSSCDPETETPKPIINTPNSPYDTGVFIANEGNFSTGTGSISFYNPTDKKASLDIFGSVNTGKKLGYVQSMTSSEKMIYIVLNSGDKVQIVNDSTFADGGTITSDAIVSPRYMSAVNGKGYLSVWGGYDENWGLKDSYILVIDLKTKMVTDTIDTDEGVENLSTNGTRLFASINYFGGANKLAAIDLIKNKVVDDVELSYGPAQSVFDVNNKLWVICQGTYEGNDGALYRLNPATLEIEDSIGLGINPGGRLVLGKDGKELYYSTLSNIYKIAITAESAPSEPIIAGTKLNGLGYDVKNDLIYVGKTVDYLSNGTVIRYQTDGTKVDEFNAGIAPSGFIFR